MRCLLNGVLRRPDDFLSKYSMQACVSILDISVRTCGQFIEKIRSSKMDITARTLDKPRFLPPFVSENNSHLWYKSYSVEYRKYSSVRILVISTKTPPFL